ncbi:MAG: protein translocase subunit SecD [Candidatus Moranbacteria bacterium]|nr:protein translocase subunit SecD [Candidatus Moranbacteria bacterium]
MKPKIFTILLILALFILSAAIASPAMPDFNVFNKNLGKILRDQKIKLGLDLQGGAHLVYRADLSKIDEEDKDLATEAVRDVIEKRVNAYGVSEPQITTNRTEKEYRIIIDLAGIEDVNRAIEMIGQTPVLDFREPKNEQDYQLSEEEKQVAIEKNQAIKKKAEEVLEKALIGENFEELAKEYSEDLSNKDNGGSLGYVKKSTLQENYAKEFQEVLLRDDFEVGTIWPELVRTDFGYHIIKKEDVRGEGEETEIKSSHILFKTVSEEKRPETELFPYKRTELDGKYLKRAQLVFDQNTGEPMVQLEFDSRGTELFKEITERNLGQPVAIYLDGFPRTQPVVQNVITNGKAVINGIGSQEEAKQLAIDLNSGALPVPIELISQENIGASLGQKSLDRSLEAGLYGIIALVIFMFIVYLFLGLVAALALGFYAVLMVAIFKLTGITLTLSGIAGFVLSLGMAVDANILIFERIKEELKQKRSLVESIDSGFSKAWVTIRDGNLSTIITCVVLIMLGTGVVKGFATTLFIGVLLSMFTAVFITRNLMEFLADKLGNTIVFGLIKKNKKKKSKKK